MDYGLFLYKTQTNHLANGSLNNKNLDVTLGYML